MPAQQAKTTIQAGACGFTTTVHSSSDDGQMVRVHIESECPHVQQAAEELTSLDAYAELFSGIQKSTTYKVLAEHLPHPTCPLYSGVLKAVEAAAGLALPKDVHIEITVNQDSSNP